MQWALERHKAREARVIPVILRPVNWKDTPIGELQGVPTEGKPITKWRTHDEAFEDVAKQLSEVVSVLATQLSKTEKQVLSHISSREPLHIILILDCSGSMEGEKIRTVNTAMKHIIPELRYISQSNDYIQLTIRVVKFSFTATWSIADPTPIEVFQWEDVIAGGISNLGKALMLVADQLKHPPMEAYGFPPILLLITDGYPSGDFSRGLKAILDQPQGHKSVRIGIGVGVDTDYSTLERVIANNEIKPLYIGKIDVLIQQMRELLSGLVEPLSENDLIDPFGLTDSEPNLPALDIKDFQTRDVW